MHVRTYEALYIVPPTLTDDEVQTIAKGVERLVTEAGGAIVRSEVWGKRRLAYTVKRFSEGIFLLVRFQSPSAFLQKLETHYRLHEDIIRFQTVHFDEKMLKLEIEQLQRTEAAMKARETDRERGEEDEEEDDTRPRRRGPRPQGRDYGRDSDDEPSRVTADV